MSDNMRLRKKSDTVINFTKRIDVNSSQILFEISQQSDRTFRYRITLRSWSKIESKVAPKYDMALQFERGGEPAHRVDLGPATCIIRGKGVVSGMIEGGVDPSAIGVKIIISDPSEAHRIVISGSKGRPDVEDADIDDTSTDHDPAHISPIRSVFGKGDGLINTYVQDDVAGGWNLKLRNVECPHLVISPIIGKQAMSEDAQVQRLVFPEIVRRIITELALHPDAYESEPWVRHWQKFAATLSGVGDWMFFTAGDEAPDVDTVHARANEAVARYCEKYLAPAPVGAITETTLSNEG
jgi:hypothetical protein